MKTLIFSLILCFFTLQVSTVPAIPCNKAERIKKARHIFRPKKVIAPAIDEEMIVLNSNFPGVPDECWCSNQIN